ncbi:sporulation protein Cse60 [Clostridium sp. YIM B02505]|uniref:Sporulation protein Cse60 n=1 Tax=Clostridium yunnanense TaxID=2800325 RepID=A0ABS1EMF8_9CLOT|nr:sporulation protein Cse60 [Clostridium yunnanense]MBK1810549.1 sporulation protein Cse60 [Clostridium yunnanense]
MTKVLELKRTRSLEEDINKFIGDNPSIKIIDIKYCISSYIEAGSVKNCSGALIVYEESNI